jgi:ATP/maltotriose-dependent transcriptional regulator MalT
MMDSMEVSTLSSGDLEALSRLTDREREILKLIFEGLCSNEVAQALSVSKRTVDFHLARAYVKLGVSNRSQAFRRAVELGIVVA